MGYRRAIRTLISTSRGIDRNSRSLQRLLDKKQALYDKMKEIEQNEEAAQCFDDYVEKIQNLHKECKSYYNWNQIKNSREPSKPIDAAKNTNIALQYIELYKPSLMDKLLKRVEKKTAQLNADLEAARKKDAEIYKKAIKVKVRVAYIVMIFLCLLFFSCSEDTSSQDVVELENKNERQEEKTAIEKLPEISAKYRDMITVIPFSKEVSCTLGYKDAEYNPIHDVTLSAYEIGQYEVTFELWEEVKKWSIDNNKGYKYMNPGVCGCKIVKKESGGYDKAHNDTTVYQPVAGMMWYDALIWCNAYSEMSGLEPVYKEIDEITVFKNAQGAYLNLKTKGLRKIYTDLTADGYRLPTEAEWEFANRGGDINAEDWETKYSGSNKIDVVGWIKENSSEMTHDVGTKKPNRLKLYDMIGNVAEFCSDAWNSSPASGKNPIGIESGWAGVIVKGYSFNMKTPKENGNIKRMNCHPTSFDYGIGFRVAKTITK